MNPPASPTRRVRVWDLPLRIFHWLLLAAVATAFYAIKTDNIDLHSRAGYTVLGLLLFRIVWGFIGGTHARFGQFIKGPGAILAYLRAPHDKSRTGHNPLGALSVIALLAALLTQAITGLFNYSDSFFFEGPLYKHISSATFETVYALHQRFEWLILGLIALHILAIIAYAVFKRDNLVTPMITGSKAVAEAADTADAQHGSLIKGLIVAAIAAAAVWYIVTRL